MNITEAIDARFSCRAFVQEPVDEEICAKLDEELARLSEESGMSFQLYGPREDGFVIEFSPKLFANNPPLYAALVAEDNPLAKEQIGYYGEKFVLYATQLGLGTCWLAGTFDRDTARAEIAEGEALHDVIALGYVPEKLPLRQREIRKKIRARSKKQDAMWQGPQSLAESPEWVQAAIDAVWKGPSACNEQPVTFVQAGPDTPITVRLERHNTRQEDTDLGIAKLHFELAAREHGVNGTWEWGDNGAFVTE